MQNQSNNNFSVRDLRKKRKFFIDDFYLDGGYAKKCGVYATGIYLSLCRHADKEQRCYPSHKKMAEELDISQRQVGRAIKILERWNIVRKIRTGKKLNNRYLLLDESEWTDSPIAKDCQSNQLEPNSPLHIKDSQLRIHNKKDEFFSSKELVQRYRQGDRTYKPFYWDMKMVIKDGKFYCIPKDGGKWMEFSEKESKIEWRDGNGKKLNIAK